MCKAAVRAVAAMLKAARESTPEPKASAEAAACDADRYFDRTAIAEKIAVLLADRTACSRLSRRRSTAWWFFTRRVCCLRFFSSSAT
jgi:hypothetical protein